MLDFEPESRGTNLSTALRFFTDAMRKRCSMFLISDFITADDYRQSLSMARNKHDVMAIQIYDKRDAQLPDVGLMRVHDLETGRDRWIDTSSKRTRKAYDRWWYDRQQDMSEKLHASRVNYVSVATDEDYVKALIGLFKNRTQK